MATKEHRQVLKLLLLGEAEVGKTALLSTYIFQRFPQLYTPTREIDFLQHTIQVQDETISLQIWDTAGQEKYQILHALFYSGADCCVLVYDCTSRVSFERLKHWRDDVLTMGQVRREEFPFVLVGNKADREGERQVGWSEAQTWARSNGDMPLFETSARLDSDVKEAFEQAAKLALLYHISGS